MFLETREKELNSLKNILLLVDWTLSPNKAITKNIAAKKNKPVWNDETVRFTLIYV